MEKTIPHPDINEERVGYVLNSEFSSQNQQKIQELQTRLVERFGDAILLPAPETLHITLMDWLAPLVDYEDDKDDLFEEVRRPYNAALEAAIGQQGPVEVRFNQISVGPHAIFIKGEDGGQYQQIRSDFLSTVELLPNTKKPPQIIHSTIARYNQEIDLSEVQDFINTMSIDFMQTIDEFRLLRTTDTRMAAKLILKKYKLPPS